MYLTVEQVTAFALTVIKDKNTASRNIWREWIYQCVLDLGCSDNEIKVCVLYPKDGIAKLPEHCRQIIEVSLFDSSGCNLLHQFRPGKNRIYTDLRQLPSASAGNTNNTTVNNLIPVDVSNDEYSIFLGTNGSNVASIALRYFAYPIDDVTKMPLIREEDMMCILHYLRFMESLRSNDNRSEIEQNKQLFFQEADRARARKKSESMTFEKSKTLMKDLMNLLPLNNLSKF